MGATLFGKSYEIRIGQPGQEGKVFKGSPDSPGLQVSFEVELSLKGRSDKATVRLTNLSREFVGFIEQEGNVITIAAGYGSNIALLFSGEIVAQGVKTTHEGPDKITTIEAGASELALTATRFSRGYSAGTPIKTIIEDIVAALGIGRGTLDRVAGTDKTYSTGAAFFGPARRALDEIVAQLGPGYTWAVSDGQLLLLEPSESADDTAILLTEDTGLVGNPQRKKNGLDVTSLLQPKLRPGKIIEVHAPDLEGFYRAQKVRFVCDYRATDWYAHAECKEIG